MLLFGHVITQLQSLPADSVHCCVTSPPYWGLRNYGTNPQIWPDSWHGELGLEPTPELYVQHLVQVFREVRRVLRPDGTLWLNLGDTYQDKNLCGIPWRVAFALQADGWYLRPRCPWIKRNKMPESATDRPAVATEDIFLFSKSGDNQYWTHDEKPIGARREPGPDYRWENQSDGSRTEIEPPQWRNELLPNGKRLWKRINLWSGHSTFYDHHAVKMPLSYSTLLDGRNATGRHTQGKIESKYYEDESPDTQGADKPSWYRSRTFVNPESGRNRRDTDWFMESWQGMLTDDDGDPLAFIINTVGYPEAHFATFPPKLVQPMILAGTSAHGCCPQCQAPYERIIEKTDQPNESAKGSKFDHGKTAIHQQDRSSSAVRTIKQPTGWQPTCSCSSIPPFTGGQKGGSDFSVSEFQPLPAVVLDPFCGSGTTLQVAAELNRNYIGIELDEKNRPLIEQRLATTEKTKALFI